MKLINGAWQAVGDVLTFKPLVGFEVEDGPFTRVELGWGEGASVVARRRNLLMLLPMLRDA